jgi:hypothetical protein
MPGDRRSSARGALVALQLISLATRAEFGFFRTRQFFGGGNR